MIAETTIDYVIGAGPTILALAYGVLRIETRLRRIESLCKSRGDNCRPPHNGERIMRLREQDSTPE